MMWFSCGTAQKGRIIAYIFPFIYIEMKWYLSIQSDQLVFFFKYYKLTNLSIFDFLGKTGLFYLY